MQTRAVLAEPHQVAGGPLPGLMLLLASPRVGTVQVREAFGEPVPVRELGRTPDFTVFVADVGAGGSEGFGYTAYDGTGAVVEEAIT